MKVGPRPKGSPPKGTNERQLLGNTTPRNKQSLIRSIPDEHGRVQRVGSPELYWYMGSRHGSSTFKVSILDSILSKIQ